MNNLLWFVAGAIAMNWWLGQQQQAAAAGQPAPTSPVATGIQQLFTAFNKGMPPQPTCPPGQVATFNEGLNYAQTGVGTWQCYRPMPVA